MRHALSFIESGLGRAVFVIALCLLSACGGPTAVIGVGAESLETQSRGVTTHDIFFATTRARTVNQRIYFGGARRLAYTPGRIEIGIPPGHETGQLELARSDATFDPDRHFAIGTPVLFSGTDNFVNELQRELNTRAPKDRTLLIFVHGYNTSFSDAVARVSQFVHDTGFTGVPVLFTWASRARALDYVYDLNSALQSRFHLAELALAMERLNAREFSIVAHSMGNLATLETLVVLQSMKEFKPRGKLKAIILAAPDVDVDLFAEHIRALHMVRDKIFVIISKDDAALGVSRLIAGDVSRAGAADPDELAKMGITVIDLSDIQDGGSLGHSKFADSPEIVQLIGQSLGQGNTLSTQPQKGALQSAVGGVFEGVRSVVGGGAVLVFGN